MCKTLSVAEAAVDLELGLDADVGFFSARFVNQLITLKHISKQNDEIQFRKTLCFIS